MSLGKSIGFLGGGKIAQAMAKGFIAAGLTKAENLIASCHPADLSSITAFKELGGVVVVENNPVVKQSDIVILSVKPYVVSQVLNDVKNIASGKLFISVAMGIPIRSLEENLPRDAKVVRVMPNTPALVQQACSVFVRGTNVKEEDATITKCLFEAIGTCEEAPESLIDAVTGLSGSGPGYICILIEALADGGVKMGLPRDMAYRLASQTVLGTAQLIKESKRHPAALKDDVSSPAGSTIAGLIYLENKAFRATVAGAVEAATIRCKEISGSDK